MPLTADMAEMADSPERSKAGFLHLAVELRLQIYEYALAPTGDICACPNTTPEWLTHFELETEHRQQHTDDCHSNSGIGLLRTCCQVYAEAKDVLFKHNITFLSLYMPTNNPVRRDIRVAPSGPHAVHLDVPDTILPRLQHVFLCTELADSDITLPGTA